MISIYTKKKKLHLRKLLGLQHHPLMLIDFRFPEDVRESGGPSGFCRHRRERIKAG